MWSQRQAKRLEFISNLHKMRNCTICVVKTKALCSYYAENLFSHGIDRIINAMKFNPNKEEDISLPSWQTKFKLHCHGPLYTCAIVYVLCPSIESDVPA